MTNFFNIRTATRFFVRSMVAIAWTAVLVACGDPTAGPDYIPTGTVAVAVRDQTGVGVSGAHVQILDPASSFVWTEGTSTSDGTVSFVSGSPPGGLLGGSYRASLSPPTGYVIAAGQVNPMTFTVSDKTTTRLTLLVTRTP